MNDMLNSNKSQQGKRVFAAILVVLVILPALFFLAIDLFKLKGLPLYFFQLGLYALFYMLAFWGMKREKIALPFNLHLFLQAVVVLLTSWLLYVLVILLTGLTKLPVEIESLGNIPAWKIWANIFSTWFFVGLGEEVVFRGYCLPCFERYFTKEGSRRRTFNTILITSVFFSLWHIPARVTSIIAGELDLLMLLISLIVVFVYGAGFAYLFLRSRNIILVGLVHGVMNYPIIGQQTQASFFVLLAAIGCVEIVRWVKGKKQEKSLQIPT
jgi:membrane protease YdiL (CAAX protease family)